MEDSILAELCNPIEGMLPEFWIEATEAREEQTRLANKWFTNEGSLESLLNSDALDVKESQELSQEYLSSLLDDVDPSLLSYEEQGSQQSEQQHPEAELCGKSPDALGITDAVPAPEFSSGYRLVSSLILKCGEAAAANDSKEAYRLVNILRDHACRFGTGDQRMGHYFAEALVARITGTGGMLYKALCANRLPLEDFFDIYRVHAEVSPAFGMPIFFTNQTILDETVGATRVHVVDYGIGHGFRWLCLIKDLSERSGGSPKLRITGVDVPHHQLAVVPVKDVGYKLEAYAKQAGVPFEFHAVVSEHWELLSPTELEVRPEDKDEVLIVSCINKLKYLSPGELPRKRFFSSIYSMKPKVFIEAEYSSSCNSPCLVDRLQHAVPYYTAAFDSQDQTTPKSSPERLRGEILQGLGILNLVACEGEDRNQRMESHRKWQMLTRAAGFKQQRLKRHICEKAKQMIQTYHKGFDLAQDGNWLTIRWKGQIQDAMCSWKVTCS